MVINNAPITLCLEPITECILPQRKGAANAAETATMISMTSRGSGSLAGPAARRPGTASTRPLQSSQLRQRVAKSAPVNVSRDGKFPL
jgi:hypothetical protein